VLLEVQVTTDTSLLVVQVVETQLMVHQDMVDYMVVVVAQPTEFQVKLVKVETAQ
jgi:hypothetical protein